MPLFDRKIPDPRVVATRTICRWTIPILALCIPLVGILKEPILPFLVIGGASLAISSVWFFGRSKVVATHSKEIDALEQTVEDLKNRLEGVEVRNRFEEALAEKAFGEQADSNSETVGGRSMGAMTE